MALADIRVIRCVVNPQLARERAERRNLTQPAEQQGRRRREIAKPGEAASSALPFEPLSLPVPTLDVDTTERYDPELSAVVAFLLSRDTTTGS